MGEIRKSEKYRERVFALISYLIQDWFYKTFESEQYGAFELIHQDPLVIVKLLFARADLETHISLKYTTTNNSSGERVFADPCSGTDFESYEVGLDISNHKGAY